VAVYANTGDSGAGVRNVAAAVYVDIGESVAVAKSVVVLVYNL